MSDPIGTCDGDAVHGEFKELARRVVEAILSTLLEEADDLGKADRYERTAKREAYAGGGHVLRREERAHVGDRQVQIRCRQRVGLEEVSGRHAAGPAIVPRRMGRSCKVRKKSYVTDASASRALSEGAVLLHIAPKRS